MSTQGQVMSYARKNKRKKAVPDLNVLPVETVEQASPGSGPSITAAHGDGQAPQPAGSTQPAPIDVEDLDDDVVISSPRAFEEAKKRSRRTRRTVVVDVEAEEAAGRYKRRRGPPFAPVINCELYVNLDGDSSSMLGVLAEAASLSPGIERERARYVAPPPPPPPPKEPTFSCPVCMGPLVEEVTTKCGHIFCKACIKAAINAQHKCPTCRQKLTTRNLIRVYLPSTK